MSKKVELRKRKSEGGSEGKAQECGQGSENIRRNTNFTFGCF